MPVKNSAQGAFDSQISKYTFNPNIDNAKVQMKNLCILNELILLFDSIDNFYELIVWINSINIQVRSLWIESMDWSIDLSYGLIQQIDPMDGFYG